MIQSTKQEILEFNQKVLASYKNNLEKLSYTPSSLTEEDQILVIQELVQNLTVQSKEIGAESTQAVSDINKIGETVDLGNYSELVENYNKGNIADKKKYLEELANEKQRIIEERNDLIDSQNGFALFFKKIYYTFFGTNQEVLSINEVSMQTPVKGKEEIYAFYSTNCLSYLNLDNTPVKAPEIVVLSRNSDIKTQVVEPQKSCLDENGQRTTNCCNDDSFRDREDLYPVIFVHGHASETGQKTVQASLDTFTYMESYFAKNGYVTKDTLYPEKATELTKGVWGYCKPVAVKVTYYGGIMDGSAVKYKGNIRDYAPALSQDIDAVLTATNKNKAIIVSHSMGGIISRYYVKNSNGKNKIDKLITISSPHHGTREWISLLSKTWWAEAESKQMQPNSDFLNLLNSPSDSLVESYSIMGNSKSCLGGNCDDVIYVTDAKLKNGKEFIVFNGTQYEHSSIVAQQDVAQRVFEIINKN